MTGNPLLDSDEYARLLSPQESAKPRRSTWDNQELCPACECPFYEKLYRVHDQCGQTPSEREFWLVQCDHCRLVRLFPWPKPPVPVPLDPDPFAGAPQNWRWSFSSHLNFIDDTIAHVEGPGILLCCARGYEPLLQLLQERGLPVVALDPSPEAAATIWHDGQVPACVADLRQPPFSPGSCGVILLLHVLEYLPDPVFYLEHVWKLLQPAGRLVVQAPNLASWQFLWRGADWRSLDVPRRLFHFRAAELRLLLIDCGFEVVREHQFTWRDSAPALASSLAPGLDPRLRRIRRAVESPIRSRLHDFLYLLLTLVVLPFALLEALAFSGATVLLEARKLVPDPKETNASQT